MSKKSLFDDDHFTPKPIRLGDMQAILGEKSIVVTGPYQGYGKSDEIVKALLVDMVGVPTMVVELNYIGD